MRTDNRQFDGKLFLEDVNIKLNNRLAEIRKDLDQGLKEIENMHDYYWENYTEMDQYGYEDYDNQQALLQQVNANRDKSKLMHRFEKWQIPLFSAESIFCLKQKKMQSLFI